MKKTYDPIYKLDTKGKTRIWYMEQDGLQHRTIAGIKGGNLVESGWTQCVATNVGQSNERDPVAQATFEIEAQYKKKLGREYHTSLGDVDQGAHFFKPMLAEKYEEFAPGFAQPKLDGIRCIVKADGMWSRQGKPILGAPHIFETLKPLFIKEPNLVLDGELYNHDLKDDFNAIVSLVKKQKPTAAELAKSKELVQYHVYDMPSVSGVFSYRLAFMEDRLFGEEPEGVRLVETRIVEGAGGYDQFHGQWLEEGYEGSMWRADAPYEQKRSKALRKRKEFQDEEFEVVRIEEGLGNWAGVAKRVVCKLKDGREFGAGIKGSKERAAQLLHEKHNVVTVKFFALTPDGIPRFPVATVFHGAERTL